MVPRRWQDHLLSLDHTSLLIAQQLVPERRLLRKGFAELSSRSCKLIVGTLSRSIVVNHLQALLLENEKIAIAFIYCNYKEQAEHTVYNLVASLLKQMLQDRRAISGNIKSFYERHRRQGTPPTLDEVVGVLTTEIETYTKVFVVVDALDECREDDATRAMLLEVLRSLPGNVNLMVTSRNLPSIARDFGGAKRLHIRAKDDDIRKYIEGRLALGPRHLKQLQETIVDRVTANANGMYVLPMTLIW